MTIKSANPTISFSGAQAPSLTAGRKEFESHDATKTWDDSGASERITGELCKTIKSEIANQTTLAVADYVGAGEFEVMLRDKELHVSFRISNDVASMARVIRPIDLFRACYDDSTGDPAEQRRYAEAALKSLIECREFVLSKHNGPPADDPVERELDEMRPKARRKTGPSITAVDMDALERKR